ncbi:MAG: hypothetical protein IPM74_06940 [Crocinitomicaceae bacterium]|nr:hypothetical protein [Crocinitomicaceae bacterium]MBK8925635.1 hypothetical protein [Crocinitomicaceae bacterium]
MQKPLVNVGTTINTQASIDRKNTTQNGQHIVARTIGIKSILNPPKNKQMENEAALLPDLAEHFTHTDLMAVWNGYALNLRREKKDSLYATLTSSEPHLNSEFAITLDIANSAQALDLEREKVNLLAHLRSQLRNYKISFNYKISEKKQSFSTDTKSTFEKLAEENPSLHKFRKLFNLDIDF